MIVATLTGLESDASALAEAVALDTHIRDVVTLLEREDLHDVILVGHSYAGMIITGVAEHARDRIAHLVYVDALVPEHGQSAMRHPARADPRHVPEAGRRGRRLADAAERPSPRPVGARGGSGPDVCQKRRLCDFTIRCFEQPLDAPTHAAHMLPRTYIASVKEGYPAKAVFDPFAARARREGWSYHELPTPAMTARRKCRMRSVNCFSPLSISSRRINNPAL